MIGNPLGLTHTYIRSQSKEMFNRLPWQIWHTSGNPYPFVQTNIKDYDGDEAIHEI